jgi:hypothetical protein
VFSSPLALTQMMAAAGRGSVTLWDAQSGTFLGNICCFGQIPEGPVDIDPAAGVPRANHTGRAIVGADHAPLPLLGAPPPEPLAAEEQSTGQQIGTAVIVASTFARRCALTARC